MASQATGRLWRLMQKDTVVQFEISIEGTFQRRVIQNAIQRALPGVMAELSIPMKLKHDSAGDPQLVVGEGDWFLVDGQLVSATDPAAEGLPASKKLTIEKFIEAILDLQGGLKEKAEEWVSEEVMEGDIDEQSSIADDEDEPMN
jgi:hypothetical protein